jgi:hypothetical protein
MDLLDTERGLTGEEAMVYLLSLPQKRKIYDGEWKATQIMPCPLLVKCAACLRYLPPTSFYVLKSGKNGRIDALGLKRSARCVQCHHADYTKLDDRQKLYYAARQRANLKGHEFTITLDDVVVPECCPVFGFKLAPTIGQGRLPLSMLERSPSLDRIDNGKGYVPGNVCVISLRANNVKKDATLNELRALVRYMEEFGSSDVTEPAPETTATTRSTEVML